MNTTSFIPDGSQNDLIKAQLAHGESIAWVGQEPRARYLAHRILGVFASAFIALVAALFTVIMFTLNPSILRGSLQGLLPVLIPLAIFGFAVYGLVRAVQALVKGRPALYVVTDQRALLIEQGTSVEVKAYGPEAIHAMQITKHKNGRGRIIFERDVSWERDSEGRSVRRVVEIGFFGLTAVDEVCRHLRRIERPETTRTLGGDALAAHPLQSTLEADAAFYMLETSALHEYLYKVVLRGGQVCGAKVAGSFSAMSLRHMGDVSGYGFLFAPIAHQVENREQKREARYQELDPLGPAFLAADKANFRYGSLDIDHVVIAEEYKTLESGYNASGRLEIHLRADRVRKFWLTRNADPAVIAQVFCVNSIRVEVKDTTQAFSR